METLVGTTQRGLKAKIAEFREEFSLPLKPMQNVGLAKEWKPCRYGADPMGCVLNIVQSSGGTRLDTRLQDCSTGRHFE
jgi:hypothetical protein